MRILFADKFPDSHIERLRVEGHDVVTEPNLTSEGLAEALAGIDVLVVRSTRVPGEVIQHAAALSMIVRAGAGVNTIDVAAAAARGVVVANTPGKNAIAVAELTMGLILAIDRNIPDNVADVRAGKWNKKLWSATPGIAGRSIGIIGFGAIGQALALRAHAFDLEIVLVDRPGRSEPAQAVVDIVGPRFVASIDELVASVDIVTVHIPSAPNTEKLISRKLLTQMRDSAVLINTSRGDIVDEVALLELIDEKELRVGIDVFQDEPSSSAGSVESALARHPRVYATHHIGASTEQSEAAVADEVVSLVESFARGEIRNAVNVTEEPLGAAVITVRHADRVGVLAAVLDHLRQADLNVEHMENRIFAGAHAASATIHVDGHPSADVLADLESIPDVIAVRVGTLGGLRPLVRPFRAHLPRPELAGTIVAPPVSSITRDRFEALVRDNDDSILHVLRGAIDSASGVGDGAGADAEGATRLDDLIGSGKLILTDAPGFYVYRTASEGRSHLSVIGEMALSGVQRGSIRPHEKTRPETEDLVLKHLRVVRAHTDPVAVTYRFDAGLSLLLDEVVGNSGPLLDFTSHDGSSQQLWPVAAPDMVAAIAERLSAAAPMYVTDGHHRIAAAVRLADELSGQSGEIAPSTDYIPTVFIADDQIDVLGYHRAVTDLGDHTPESLLGALRENLIVEELTVNWDENARPRQAGVVGMRLGDRWHRLTFPTHMVPTGAFDSLDAVMLQTQVLGPLLGIGDPRSDPRLRYIPGPAGLAALVDAEYAIAFALYPPTTADVMQIADLGTTMPPKSTWFEPKVKAGLVVRTLS